MKLAEDLLVVRHAFDNTAPARQGRVAARSVVNFSTSRPGRVGLGATHRRRQPSTRTRQPRAAKRCDPGVSLVLGLAAPVRPVTMVGSMAGKSQSKAVKSRVVPEDLEAVVREAVRTTPGLKSSQVKKALPTPYQAFAKEAQGALRLLAERGEVYRALIGKTELFFRHDPRAALDEIVPQNLSREPLEKSTLKALVRELAPGHELIFDHWLTGALTRGLVFEHAPAPASKEKRYGNRPDVGKNLAPVLTALKKALLKTDEQGIPRHRIAEVLLRELGVSPGAPQTSSNGAPPNHSAHEQFLAGLRELAAANPRQALLSVRDLRARLALSKEQFDAVALDLMRDGLVSLHYHDHPASLPEAERSQLVQDGRGNYYIGIAPGREE